VLKENKEELIWIEGYKGLRKDLTLKDHLGIIYQCKVGQLNEVEKNTYPIRKFHLSLKDAISYCNQDNNNTFYKIKALINKKHLGSYESFKYIVANTIQLVEAIDANNVWDSNCFKDDNIIETREDYIESLSYNNLSDFKQYKISEQCDVVTKVFSELYGTLIKDRILNFRNNDKYQLYILKEVEALISMNLSNDMLVYHIEKLFN
jgi:hypothetical protein